MSDTPRGGVVGLLTAQALAFGVSLALVIIPANALFLDAYGSEWLPATYIAIAVFGSGASALIARAARRTRLVRIAAATIGALAALYAASWLILIAGGVWASAVLLVLFPIALQLGFVFIGGQAGRLLDVRQMKERFPRVVSGFAVGFLLGGLLGIPLLALLGSTEHLLLASTAAQLAFLGLLIVTERRFPEVRAAPAEDAPAVARPPLRTLFASGLVLLLLVYQVLSAMGSQVVDFLLFDRAAAQYSGDDLTRFLSAYTAALNVADILFLALLAGPLMRRFGLRLGLVLNPAVITAVLAVMAVVAAGPGAATFGLFVLAGVVRIADIVATDGTTRTSINASYQIVPVEERLAVQAVVEGIGVPVAIGVTGVLLLALNVLDLGTGAVIVFGLTLGAIWTVIAVGVYRSYARALADEMRSRPLGAGLVDITEEEVAVRALLRSDDARDVRLGLDLLAGVVSPASAIELREVARHADAEVRVRALAQLASSGDAGAAGELAACVDDLAHSAEPADRRAAAIALGSRDTVAVDTRVVVELLDDVDPTVRAAALDAVGPGDAGEPEVVRRVVAAVEEPRTTGSATAALRRLGDAAVPFLRAAVNRDGTARRGLARAGRGDRRPRARRRPDRTGARRPRSRRRAGRRSMLWRRRDQVTCCRPSSSMSCSATLPPTPPALSKPVSRSRDRRGRCTERWRTRSTSRVGSSSRCSRCVTAIESGRPCASSTMRTASAAHSGSRRSTSSSRVRRPQSHFRSCAASKAESSGVRHQRRAARRTGSRT